MKEESAFITKIIETGGFIWFVVLAIWGGTVNYLSRLKQGKNEVFSFAELIGEWTVSGFAGILTAYICVEMQMSWHMTAFLAGVSGHLGGRAIFMFESYAKKHIPWLNTNDEINSRKDSEKDDV